jgi:hypothetical protein
MAFAVSDQKVLGYGGAGYINNVQVLITGGTVNTANSISYMNAVDISPTQVSRSRMRHADGTRLTTANLTFDLTDLSLNEVMTLYSRRALFGIEINDGNNSGSLGSCFANNITLSGAPGGLISGSVQATSIEDSTYGSIAASRNDFIREPPEIGVNRDEEPLAYYFSGNTDVRSWTLTMNQEVSPVYLNENGVNPGYLKVTRWDFQLDVVTYTDQSHNDIEVRTNSWTLKGDTTASSYSFNGVTDFGMFSHSFATSADITTGAGDSIITIV